MPLRFRTNGDACHRARELAGLSAREAGRLCDVSGQHIRNVELGMSEASPGLRKRMAEVYSCAITDLVIEESADDATAVPA